MPTDTATSQLESSHPNLRTTVELHYWKQCVSSGLKALIFIVALRVWQQGFGFLFFTGWGGSNFGPSAGNPSANASHCFAVADSLASLRSAWRRRPEHYFWHIGGFSPFGAHPQNTILGSRM